MVGFITGQTVHGNLGIVNVEQICTAVEGTAGGSDLPTVTINTRDGKRLELLMNMEEFLMYVGRLPA
mgnify:CR=1 FL=1